MSFSWTPPDWLLPFVRPFLWVWEYIDLAWQKLGLWLWGRKRMLRIGVVGDLSLQDPARLERAMAAAYPAVDILVHVGDIHPGYSVVKKYAAMGKIPVYAVPGNHDTEWDQQLGWTRQWNVELELCHLAGLDNSKDVFLDADKVVVSKIPNDIEQVLLFVHKPLSTIVLPDGSESSHDMGEGSPCPDAEWLKSVLLNREILYIHGHYHGWTYMKTNYGDALIEGRGGAAPEIGWTLITVMPEGIVIHRMDL